VVVLVGTTVAANNCSHTCGGIEIPHPFGIIDDNNPSSDCFLGRFISLTCNDSKIYTGNMELLNINISKAEIDVLFDVSYYCSVLNHTEAGLESNLYTISSKENKFVTVGYDSYGYFNIFDGEKENKYSTGCLTRSFGDERLIDNGTCSGIGCCQVDIPPRMWNISIEASNFNDSSKFCSYSFVVKNGSYTFNSAHLLQGGFPSKELPVVLDWTIGGFDENCSTASSKNNGVNYACKNNSHCYDQDMDFGYQCRCNTGYEGNPYHPNGCTGQFFYSNFGNLHLFLFSFKNLVSVQWHTKGPIPPPMCDGLI